MLKNIMTTIGVTVMAVCMVGCDEIPTVNSITAVSTVIGKTAGYACELSKINTEVKETIFTILDVVSKVVPETNKTFTEAWTPAITEELDMLIAKNKIKQNEVTIVKTALTAVTEGLDYVFVKYPKSKDTKELVSAATNGFISGYKSVVTIGDGARSEIDEEAYAYLKAKLIK